MEILWLKRERLLWHLVHFWAAPLTAQSRARAHDPIPDVRFR
jgi:hypothetical protein